MINFVFNALRLVLLLFGLVGVTLLPELFADAELSVAAKIIVVTLIVAQLVVPAFGELESRG